MAKEIFEIDPNMLKEHKKASALIPGMSEKEWGDFFENVMQVGIRQPLDINTSYEVLDGRHRLKAARKLGLNTVKVIQHDLTPDEEMKFVRDTAIERRNLSAAQRLDIVFNAEELIKAIYEEGRENQGKRNDLTSVSGETKVKSKTSDTKIAELADSSRPTVARFKRIKREDPRLYKDVVDGKKTISGAYRELPPKKDPGAETKLKQKIERGDNDVKRENKTSKNSNLTTFKNEKIDEEERKELILSSESLSLKESLNQLILLVNEIDDLEKVIELDFEPGFYRNAEEILNKVINVINKQGSAVK